VTAALAQARQGIQMRFCGRRQERAPERRGRLTTASRKWLRRAAGRVASGITQLVEASLYRQALGKEMRGERALVQVLAEMFAQALLARTMAKHSRQPAG
jgi:hypothetical protein